MATFRINAGYDNVREVVANEYATVGDFADFYDASGTVLRLRASNVYVIERIKD